MTGMDIPKTNFVGKLQEKCQQIRCEMPEYNESDSSGTVSTFRFTCKLKNHVTHGISVSKKFAKQIAAKEMLDKIQNDKSFMDLTDSSSDVTRQKTSVSKLYEYCTKEKKGAPLYAELPSEDDYFCIRCTMDGFHADGKGKSKKEARENAAFEVATHFGIHEYCDNLVKLKKEMEDKISPISALITVCKKRHLADPTFAEEKLTETDGTKYKVTCCVGDLRMESSYAHSKKSAKIEAATLVLQLLQNETPHASPSPVATSSNLKSEISETSPDETPHASSPAVISPNLKRKSSETSDEPQEEKIFKSEVLDVSK